MPSNSRTLADVLGWLKIVFVGVVLIWIGVRYAKDVADMLSPLLRVGWQVEEMTDEMTGKRSLVASKRLKSNDIAVLMSWRCAEDDLNGGVAVNVKVENGKLAMEQKEFVSLSDTALSTALRMVSIARFKPSDKADPVDLALAQSERFTNVYEIGFVIGLVPEQTSKILRSNQLLTELGFSSLSEDGLKFDEKKLNAAINSYSEGTIAYFTEAKTIASSIPQSFDKYKNSMNYGQGFKEFDGETFVLEVTVSNGEPLIFSGDGSTKAFIDRCGSAQLKVFNRFSRNIPSALAVVERQLLERSLLPMDTAEAVDKYRQVASKGNTKAQVELGLALLRDKVVPKNHSEAEKWLRLAAESGDARSQTVLGALHAGPVLGESWDIPENLEETGKWLTRAANQGEAIGQLNLGVLYHQGEGFSKDDAEAYFWWTIAAAQGNEDARKNLSVIEEQLTEKQISDARMRADNWKPKRERE